MKPLKYTALFIIATITLFFYQCARTIRFEKEAPLEIIDAYFQKWNSGIKEGGSGINLFITTNGSSLQLDSVYFRNKVAKLNVDSKNENIYMARFMLNDKKTNLPLKLDNKDCIISYNSAKGILYFKISNLKEKELLNYPISPL